MRRRTPATPICAPEKPHTLDGRIPVYDIFLATVKTKRVRKELPVRKEPVYVGADGCRAGWFAVILFGKDCWDVQVFENVLNLWASCSDASLVLLDIPIGLIEKGISDRLCDSEARKALGLKRGASVFPAPCRPAAYAGTYEEACDVNQRMTGRRLSLQTWHITRKIREVDEFLAKNDLARSRIREIHPEVCFWALAGGRPMVHSKKSSVGRSERLRVLRRVFRQADDVIERALSDFRRKDVAHDDVLDALAAAITASEGPRRLSSLPELPEVDSRGLRMEILY